MLAEVAPSVEQLAAWQLVSDEVQSPLAMLDSDIQAFKAHITSAAAAGVDEDFWELLKSCSPPDLPFLIFGCFGKCLKCILMFFCFFFANQ